MQYPIIDLITSAYINNGWTGLDISTGKNLADFAGPITINRQTIFYSLLQSNTGQFTISIDVESNNYLTTLRIDVYNNTTIVNTVDYNIPANSNNRISLTMDLNYEHTSINFSGSGPVSGYSVTFSKLQFEAGSQATPYEPYNPNPSNDFTNRLKLPLPHYFPHPVIDALQRAAAGTQTADDTEILQHYLTPLGIGGI